MKIFHKISFLLHKFKSSKSCVCALQRNAHSQIRVRFAPSPTGHLHLGGFRTAFYNYLFAKKYNGAFVLRIEDTDSSRTIEGAASELESYLNWLFIEPDESPKKGGSYGPYFQSERRQIYDKYSKVLLQNDFAYKCFCSKERLLSLNKKKLPYDNRCRTLNSEEILKLENQNVPYCVRLKVKKETILFNDLIFGKKELKLSESDGDFVIIKTDGMPTYHFANVVDDHLMKVTHVFRGSEWLPSVPKHLHLYRCFDWKVPFFGHLPNMTNLDGTKLSKRQNDLQIRQLRQEGYSPEAILNIIKLTGGGFEHIDYEKLNTIEELINLFELERINKSNSVLDMSLLNDFNRLYVKQQISCKKSLSCLSSQLKDIITHHFENRICMNEDENFYKQVIIWGQDRISKLEDFTSSKFDFIWCHPIVSKSDIEALNFDARKVLVDFTNLLEKIPQQNFKKEPINEAIENVQMKHNLKINTFMKLIRLVVCGLKEGPPIVEAFQLVGKVNVVHRLQAAATK